MGFFYISASDRQWLGRWVRHQLIGCVSVGLLVLAGTLLRGSDSRPKQDKPIGVSYSPKKNQQETLVSITHAASDIDGASLPEGWRRTVDGWEHTSTWLADGRTMESWIEQQQSREPDWLGRLLQHIRRTPPLAFAILQLAAIGAVIKITTREKGEAEPSGS